MQTGHRNDHRGGPPRGGYHGGPPRGGQGGGGNDRHFNGGHGPQHSSGKGPAGSTGGNRVFPIRVNVFEITQLPTKEHYHYDKNLWAATRYNFGTSEVAGTFNVSMSNQNPPTDKRGMFRVALKLASTIDPANVNALVTQAQAQTPQTLTAIMLLQQLIRSAPRQIHPAQTTRSVFPAGHMQDIGGGLLAWRGFFQSVRPTIGRALVNVDTTTSAAYMAGPLYEIARKMLGERDLRAFLDIHHDRQKWNKLRSFLKGVRVVVNRGRNGRSKSLPIKDLIPEAGKYKFEDRDGHEVTVQEYYQATYGLPLRNPNMWGVRIGSTAVIPGDLCEIVPNQLFKKKIAPSLMPSMLKFAEQSPSQKLNAIRDAVRGQALDWANSVSLNDAGMRISTEPLSFDAKQLNIPRVEYGDSNRADIVAQDGSWNVVNKRFLKPATIRRWAVIDYDHHREVANQFVKTLERNLTKLGMTINSKPDFVSGNGYDIAGDVRKLIDPELGPPDLIIAILPYPAPDIRRTLKHFVFTLKVKYPKDPEDHPPRELPIATQCVVGNKLSPPNPRSLDQYCNNLALKINVKLGGVNAKVDDPVFHELRKTPTMFLGPGVHNRPSVASLVWSFDEHFARYGAASDVQSPRTEIIENLNAMVQHALLHFSAKNRNTMPTTMIMFRDGVSEGEYERVRNEECEAIRNAIAEIWKQAPKGMALPPTPKLVFVVVGKRHHIRMFPQYPPVAEGNGRARGGGNCPPGVVVDNELRSPYATDWYLLSHGGLKGTSVPAHYIVLENELELENEKIQKIAYTLCYSFHRATRAVSIPAPVYYADLVCSHAEFQFTSNLEFADETNTVTSDDFDLNRWREGFLRVNATLRERFYFL